ncbi:MAG: glycosyltransferase [Coxiellaceae bacterium]|nr:glycosyltransferase [Coxiellaceae bacterium]
MAQPFVSIIIPVYNGEKYLSDAIQSILAQTYKNYEIWVIDNASIDRSAEIANSFSVVHYLYEAKADINIARNKGISCARGDYIAFLDQDDIWEPNKLALQVHCLNEFKDYVGVIGLTRFFLESGCVKPHWLKQSFLEKPQNAYFPSVILIRKTVFDVVGLFDTQFRLAADVDWFFKIKQEGMVIAELPEVLLNRRIHGENASGNVGATQHELLLIAKKSLKNRRKVNGYE